MSQVGEKVDETVGKRVGGFEGCSVIDFIGDTVGEADG